jgi:ubiquinone/menaquinone biosynthesis C-methylase UbiE
LASRIDQLIRRAQAVAADSQPWPGQFLLRGLEIQALLSRLDVPRGARILEIGCGNAIGSAVLAGEAGMVVATDLPRPDKSSHSIGMDMPRRLLERLDVPNCHLAAASATRLPFPSHSFDVVFSSYVLEHVPDKSQAIKELRRVLMPHGLLVAFVPNFVERLYAPFFFWVYLASRFAKVRSRRARNGTGPETCAKPAFGRALRETYPSFPLPNPHGAYASSAEELRNHLPRAWIDRLTRGGFRVVDRFFLMNLPANAASLVLGDRGMRLYGYFRAVDRLLGGSAVGPALGQYACYVARPTP